MLEESLICWTKIIIIFEISLNPGVSGYTVEYNTLEDWKGDLASKAPDKI